MKNFSLEKCTKEELIYEIKTMCLTNAQLHRCLTKILLRRSEKAEQLRQQYNRLAIAKLATFGKAQTKEEKEKLYIEYLQFDKCEKKWQDQFDSIMEQIDNLNNT